MVLLTVQMVARYLPTLFALTEWRLGDNNHGFCWGFGAFQYYITVYQSTVRENSGYCVPQYRCEILKSRVILRLRRPIHSWKDNIRMDFREM